MRVQTILCAAVVLLAVTHVYASAEEKKKKKLQIGVKKRVAAEKCKIKSRKGDTLHMHYTVSGSISRCIMRYHHRQYVTSLIHMHMLMESPICDGKIKISINEQFITN